MYSKLKEGNNFIFTEKKKDLLDAGIEDNDCELIDEDEE